VTISEMKEVDVRSVDRNTLVQRNSVKVNPKKDKAERVKEYVEQIRNPYCYLDGKTVVKISFANTSRTIEDCMRGYLSGL
jgi:cytochrome oxidase Cu insertion factor (SCO1/SenC/PrrC family)